MRKPLYRDGASQGSLLCPQKKEPVGDDDTLPDSVTSQLAQLTADELRPLTVTQLKVSTGDLTVT